jgi:hypothetical protein
MSLRQYFLYRALFIEVPSDSLYFQANACLERSEGKYINPIIFKICEAK